MARPRRLAAAALLACLAGAAHGADGRAERPLSGTLTGYYNLLPDQPNYGTVIGTVQHGSVHLEARYNYEGRASTSGFVGWTLTGGQDVTWSITPLIGAVTGRVSGVVPGLEASIAYKSVDFYTEAEYVIDRNDSSNNYAYAWSELGWKPVDWLRIGLVGQRTRVVGNDRDVQRGVLLQAFAGRVTLGAYTFNPGQASRYTTVALGFAF